MKQGFEFLDTETGYRFKLVGTSETLSSDITINIPDDINNATLATVKNLEDLRNKLADGTITVKTSEYLGNKAADQYALADMSNVDLQGLNIGGNNNEGYFNTASYENFISGALPAVNNYIPFLSTVSNVNNTIDPTQKIDNTTFLLKAGRTYKIEGGLLSHTASSGGASAIFKLFEVSTLTEITIDKTTFLFSQTSVTGGSTVRNHVPNFYYTPTVDTYLKLMVYTNWLSSCTNYQTNVVITEYMSKDLALKSVTINGKSFDSNNNIDLEGLSTLSTYSLTEVLTEHRWIDGRPIYRKVVNFGALPNATFKSVPHGIANMGTIFLGNGSYSKNPTTGNVIQLPYPHLVDPIYVSFDTVNLTVSNKANDTAFTETFLTIEYTKTSDNANSPVRLIS